MPTSASHLRLLVAFLLVLVGLLILGALAYVSHQHPALATPLTVAAAGGAVLATCVGVILNQ
ncbi:hypothetical protein ACIPJG_33415 [Streptomyces halstedii]|uniref:hypothetical protein n=1 Tax=Streptomyces halstedii TaxID=1944 RepID=UPI0037F189B1